MMKGSTNTPPDDEMYLCDHEEDFISTYILKWGFIITLDHRIPSLSHCVCVRMCVCVCVCVCALAVGEKVIAKYG